MSTSEVERLHKDFLNLRSFLTDTGGLRLLSVVDETFPKTLLLAVASHLERRMTSAVEEFVREVTDDDYRLMSLIKGKVIERQYHTWFDWNGKNANKFFGMFGDGFKNHAQGSVKENDRLDDSIRAFLEIGSERNKLIHGDLATFMLNKTAAEVYEGYESATIFVEWFPNAIRSFSTSKQQSNG